MSVLERRRSSAMKLNINNISIFNKIIGYSLVLVLFFSGVIYLKFMPELEETIYSEKQNKERLLKFEDKKDNLFYMLKNDELYKLLMKDLSNNEYFKKKLIKNQ